MSSQLLMGEAVRRPRTLVLLALVLTLTGALTCGHQDSLASQVCCDCMEDASDLCEGGTFSCKAVEEQSCADVCDCVDEQDVYWQNRTPA